MHNSSFILIADLVSLSLFLKSSVRVQFFKLFDRNYLPVGCSVSACCKIHCILNLGLQFLASSANCPPGPWYLSCSPHIPVDCLDRKAVKTEREHWISQKNVCIQPITNKCLSSINTKENRIGNESLDSC